MRYMPSNGTQWRRLALLLVTVGLVSAFLLMRSSTRWVSPTSAIPEGASATQRDRLTKNLAGPSKLVAPDERTRLRVTEAYGNLPLQFEANNGQSDASVKFISRGSGYTMFLTPNEAVLTLHATSKSNGKLEVVSPQALRMKLVGANTQPHISPLEELSGKVNHFIGNDSTKWREKIPTYQRVQYDSVYPGIDLTYYGNQRQLEYDFIVAPGADPKAIRLAVSGAIDLSVDAATGDLVLRGTGTEVRQLKPVVYQEVNGTRQEVAGNYRVIEKSEFGFEIGAYDETKPLVIDPVLVYSSSLLDGSVADSANAIAVDAAGNAYVTGNTTSTNFPTVNPIQPALSGGQDVFISKFNVAGSALIYSTYLGGTTGFENGWDIAIDAAGNAYVAGHTIAGDFPTTASAFQVTKLTGSSQDTAFVTRLSASGTLFYSTYLSGTQNSRAFGIATDGAGNAYVTGQASSLGFPLTASAFSSTSAGSGFLTKLNTNLSGQASLLYSSFLGPTGFAEGRAIAVDAAGNAYITGNTNSTSTNFTSAGAFQTVFGGGTADAFVAKFNTNLSGAASRVYSTYIGGSGNDFGGNQTARGSKAIAIDTAGNAYITGTTTSTNFPVANAFQASAGGNGDAFLTKLNTTGSALVYSTYLGGSGVNSEQGRSVAVNVVGNAYVTGLATSADFPTSSPLSTADGTTGGVFLAKFTPAGNTLVYSTRFGQANDQGLGAALDGAGNAFVTSVRSSETFVTEIADPTIIGRVLDENGNPISTATVNLTGVPAATTTTDANGYFTFGLLTAGNNYTVSVSVATYTSTAQAVNNLQKNVRLDFSPVVFSISGQVTNSGAGLGGVTMTLSDGKSLTVATNGSGNYSFTNLPAGRNYTVAPSLTGFFFAPTSTAFTNLLANQTANFAVAFEAALNSWRFQGRSYIYVKLSFPDSGYTVTDWGTPAQVGNDFSVNASVVHSAGPAVQAVSTTAQIYDLGPLANGTYTFAFRSAGILVRTIQFTVSSVAPPPNPIDDQRQFVRQQYLDFLNREPDGPGWDFWT
ncbi:MAG: SBBP repeat-containing protein, partial [Pyrinomonadaceae bacterium]